MSPSRAALLTLAVAACGPIPVPAPQPPAPAQNSMVLRASGNARFAPFLDDFVARERDFIPMLPIARDSEQWSCFNVAPTGWFVELSGGEANYRPIDTSAHRRDPLPPGVDPERFDGPNMARRLVWPIEDGYIIALSSVDAGAEVWFVSRDGARVQMVAAKHVVNFVNTAHGLVAAVGQSYVTAEYGEILRFSEKNGVWSADPLMDVGEVPRALTVDRDGSLLMVTPRSLLRLFPDEHRSDLVHHGRWIALGPNSLVIDEYGTIHIGMRQAVVRLEAEGAHYAEKWLMPQNCTTLIPNDDGETCACSDEPAPEPAVAQAP